MDREAWWATVHGITESDMTKQLSTACIYIYIYIFRFFSVMVYYEILIVYSFPGLYSRALLCTCFIYSSVYQLEKAMAPHSSTLAWKIPWMQEPGRLQSIGSLRVGHD